MARTQASEEKSLRARTQIFAGLLLAISFAFLIPSLLYPKVHFGQLGKQTFASQMIESTAKGELAYGVFPTRHFLEVYEEGLVPWAEEVPVYSFLSAGLVKTFGVSPIQAGKTLSLVAFIFLIWGFARLAVTLGQPVFVFVLSAAIFPVFRLYSVQVMPDLCMTAALVWMMERVLAKKNGQAAIFLGVASLFKYYAVFTGFGIGLYFLYRKQWKPAFFFAIAVILCVLYILWFLKLGIPNPIVDSRIADGHGHFSSLEKILSWQNWRRVGLWWFVKNASLPGTALALMGAWEVYRTRVPERPFYACLWIGILLFPLFFLSSFYVHDYYGLQGSVGIALFTAFGLSYLFQKNEWFAWLSLALWLSFSVTTVQFMAKVMPDYDVIENALAGLGIPKNEFVLSVSGISKPVITYHLGQDAYIVGIDEWARPNVQARILDSRFHYAFLHEFSGGNDYLKPIEADLTRLGFKRLDLNLNLKETVFQAWKK